MSTMGRGNFFKTYRLLTLWQIQRLRNKKIPLTYLIQVDYYRNIKWSSKTIAPRYIQLKEDARLILNHRDTKPIHKNWNDILKFLETKLAAATKDLESKSLD